MKRKGLEEFEGKDSGQSPLCGAVAHGEGLSKLIRSRCLILLAVLCCMSVSNSMMYAQEAYGWNLYDDSNPGEVGPCKFDIANPSNFKILRKHDFGICAGAFIGKKYYTYTYKSAVEGSTPIAFGTYDFETGEFTQIADYSAMTTLFYDMTYDYQNKVLYALGKKGDKSTLLKVDPSDGKVTTISNLTQEYVALAADSKGQLYAEDSYGYLSKISASGEEEMLEGGDYIPEVQTQSMAFDHSTEKLYWIAPTSREGTQILLIDHTNGYYIENTELPSERQIVGLDFPFSNISKDAPGEITGFTVTPTAAGALSVNVALTAPSKTSGGGTLAPFTVTVLRNNVEILKKTGVTVGEKITCPDAVEASGTYSYKAFASNESGNGEETGLQLFIGEDIPDEVKNIQVVPTAENDGCTVSWTAPKFGINGGYITPNLKYDVVRQPDSVAVATGVSALSVEDKNVSKLGLYSYTITPIGLERGREASSVSIILGKAHETPYKCEFTNDDMPLWSIIDRNNDGVKWKRIMTDGGVSCGYSDVQADDWLISYPIKMKNATKYKIEVTASSYDTEVVEKMELLLGNGMKLADLDKFSLIESFVVSNEEGSKAKYTVYYTPDADTEKNLAIHKTSDADMFDLTIYEVLVKEASEGSLSGTVKFNGNAVPGALITLSGTDYKAATNESGEWTINNVPEAKYTLIAKKDGYATYKQEVTVTTDSDMPINIELKELKTVTATGSVTYQGTKALENAKVTLLNVDEEEQFIGYTDASGKYSISNVPEGEYKVSVTRAGLQDAEASATISEANTAIAAIDMKDKAVAPRRVQAELQDDASATITWEAPIDVTTESFYKGPGVARIGVFVPTDRSIVGTVFRNDMSLAKVSWQTDEHRGPHKKVDLVVFALDNEGNPTNKILFEKSDISNKDNEWCSYELETPISIKGGALVALRYNGYLSVLADAGVNEGLEFAKRTHVICSDYKEGNFEYLDQHNMEKNLLIEVGYGRLMNDGTAEATIQSQKKYQVVRKLDKETEQWIAVATVDAATTQYKDADFGKLPMGVYRYGVKSIVDDKTTSEPAISNRIGNNMVANVTFELTTNAGEMTTAPSIKLIDAEKNEFIATKNTSGAWTIASLPKGKYALTAMLDGFDDVARDVAYETDERDFVEKINFVERLLPAFNVKAVKTEDPKQRVISWNTANYVFDDFESYAPFTTAPSSKQCGWVYWDMDCEPTVEFENITFDYMGSAMSFMAFNPYATNPALAFFDAGSIPYSGEQYLASFGNRNAANQDYLFSPVLEYDGAATFSCVIRSFSNALGQTRVKVGYTTMEKPKTASDIIWLEENLQISDKSWQELVANVPADAKRMVLMNNTPKGYFLMIDNLFVGEEYPYADGSVKKPETDRATYEVTLDGKKCEGVDAEKNELLLSNMTKGQHTVTVTAVYASGRAESKSVTFEIDEQSGVEGVEGDNGQYGIYPNPATDAVHITGDVTGWEIVGMSGNVVARGKECDFSVAQLANGVYLVRLHTDKGTTVVTKLIKQ